MSNETLVRISYSLERLCALLEDTDYVARRCKMNALVAEMQALDAKKGAMAMDNLMALEAKETPPWSGEDYLELAGEYLAIAEKLRREYGSQV